MSINPGQAVLFLENESLLYDTLVKLSHIEFIKVKRNLLGALSFEVEHPISYSKTLEKQLKAVKDGRTRLVNGDDAIRLLRSKKWLIRILMRLPYKRYNNIANVIHTQIARIESASSAEIELILKKETALEQSLYEI